MQHNYQNLLLDLLPPGSGLSKDPDSNVGKLMIGLADEFDRSDARCVALRNESDPSTADELLDGWESSLGLPDEYYQPAALADRRAAVVSRLRDRGSQARSYYQDKAAQAGFPLFGIGKSTYNSFRCTSPCTAPLFGPGWQHWIKCHVIGSYSGNLDYFKSLLQANKQTHKLLTIYTGLLSSWTSRQTVASDLAAVGYDVRRGRFVAVSAQDMQALRVYFSDDGKTWILKTLAPTPFSFGGLGLWSNGSRWVLSTNGDDFSYIYYSDDGEHWTAGSSYHTYISDVCYGNGIWVSASVEGMQWSTDGVAWTNATGYAMDYVAVVYGGGIFVSVGLGGVLITSLDGKAWTERNSGTFFDLNSLAFGNKMFVASSSDPVFFTSSDGIAWTSHSGSLKRVRFSDRLGLFFALGGTNSVYCSRDGITWQTFAGYAAGSNPKDIVVAAEIAVLMDASRISTSEGAVY